LTVIRSATHSSYPRIGDSSWDQELRRVARERERGLADDEAVRGVEDAVASMIVAEQSRAFVDVVTDGLVRWSGPFSYVAAKLGGVRLDGLMRWFETPLYDRRPVIEGAIVRHAPILVREAQQALDVQPKALKVVLPGPVSLARAARDRAYGDRGAVARAFAAVLADEARDLAAAGVKVFQLDEPWLCRHPDDAALVVETAAAIFAAAGAGATTILSTYFGDLTALSDDLALLPGTHLGLDMVHGAGNWPLLAKLPEGRGLHLGLFDARTSRIETAGEVAERITPYREILMARDVMAGPQCGLELIPRHAAFDKLLQSRYLREKLEKEWRWRA
jgi:5-methyltetrahydropteroyltriglutamate--homocysteine methyltransferase